MHDGRLVSRCSQVFTTARGFRRKKKHVKKKESLFSSGKRCIFCDTKCRGSGRKIICVTQSHRFSIRNTFYFRAVLLRPWSRAPSLSSRPKNPRFACRYTLAGHMGVTCLVTVEITCSQRIETQRSATVRFRLVYRALNFFDLIFLFFKKRSGVEPH